MTDDIQAEAERLADIDPRALVREIAIALRRQREEGRKEAGRRWQTDAYKRGLEDGAREAQEGEVKMDKLKWGIVDFDDVG